MSEEMKGLIDLGWFGELPKEGVCPRCDGDGMVPADPEIERGLVFCPVCTKAGAP